MGQPRPGENEDVSRRAWVLFAAMSLIWGLPYFLIKVAITELSPLGVVFARIVIASLLLLPVALLRGAFAGLRPRLGWLVGLAVLEVAIPFSLIAAAEQRISSSLTGVLISVEPLFVALLALRFDPRERVSGARLIGLVVGLVGVATLLGFDVAGSTRELVGAGMVLLATLCYAGGAMLVRRQLGDVDPLGTSAATLLISVALLAPLARWWLPPALPNPRVLAAVAALGVLCTGLAFILFFALIAAAGPGRATVITYVNPAVAVVLGVVVLGEPITVATVAGFLLIIVGCWLATGSAPPGGRLAVARWVRALAGGGAAGRPAGWPERRPDRETGPDREPFAAGHGIVGGRAAEAAMAGLETRWTGADGVPAPLPGGGREGSRRPAGGKALSPGG